MKIPETKVEALEMTVEKIKLAIQQGLYAWTTGECPLCLFAKRHHDDGLCSACPVESWAGLPENPDGRVPCGFFHPVGFETHFRDIDNNATFKSTTGKNLAWFEAYLKFMEAEYQRAKGEGE